MFLVNAIKALQKKKKNAHVALFQGYNINHPDLPGIGPISGALDFLSSTTQKLSIRKFGADGGAVFTPKVPHFVVVEAKRASTLNEIDLTTQLYAQLLTLDYIDKYSPSLAGN
jgi:hypothetical protein